MNNISVAPFSGVPEGQVYFFGRGKSPSPRDAAKRDFDPVYIDFVSQSRAILLTPPGSGAIAVVRLAGPLVAPFLENHFSRATTPGRCVHGQLSDGVNVIDDPVVVLSADRSVADINLHGGPWVVRSALDLAARAGFLISTGNEIPPEAVDGRTELEREMLVALPSATTEFALTELLRQPEAWERFTKLTGQDRAAEAKAMRADHGLWHLLHPPRVAIVGPPNVGKSTLANQLFGQERSITADLPGTTRDWVGEAANLDGLAVTLLDTPGIRETTDPIEATAIAAAGAEVRSADLALWVLDASAEPAAETEMLARFHAVMCVVNKCDLPPAWEWGHLSATETVAKTGAGLDTLRARIRDHFGVAARAGTARWWTERQRLMLNAM